MSNSIVLPARKNIVHAGIDNLANDSINSVLNEFRDLVTITKTKFHKAQLFISTIFPRDATRGNKDFEFSINQINAGLQALANQHDFITITHKNMPNPSNRYDGLHLSNEGTIQFVKS